MQLPQLIYAKQALMDEFLALCEAADENDLDQSELYVTASENTLNGTCESEYESFVTERFDMSRDSLEFADSSNTSHHQITLTEDSIQSKIEELDKVRKEVISQARATVSSSGGETKERPSGSGYKLVDLNFESAAQTSNKDETSAATMLKYDSDSSDDDLMMDNKKDLSEAGKVLQKQLKKKDDDHNALRGLVSRPTHPVTKPYSKETVLTGVAPSHSVPPTVFDTFFRLKIRNPKISSSTFECYIDGHKRLEISNLRPTTVIGDDTWTTAGVVVNRDKRKSANGKDYLIWRLHDLKDCQQPPVVVLLFGEACKEYWKLQVGVCVALLSPQMVNEDKDAAVGNKFKSKCSGAAAQVTLKVFKPIQVVELGYSCDLGTCKGVKLDGQKCSNFVNVSFSEYCVHHVMKAARKLSANRGAFNSMTSHLPPRRAVNTALGNSSRGTSTVKAFNFSSMPSNTIRPTSCNIVKPSNAKTTTKDEEQATLKKVISERASTSRPVHAPHAPQLGFGLRSKGYVNLSSTASNKPSLSNDGAKLRAIAVLKRKGTSFGLKPANRINENNDQSTIVKRSKLSSVENAVDIDALLKRKSLFESEANKAQALAAQEHLDSLEAREKVETFVTECMLVKDVKVVSCKKCGYTAQRRSDLCLREGHVVTYSTAEKRFFKCGSCHKRTIAFGMMPTKPCKHCDANEWIRVAMKDERKVTLENEKLLVRGEERKFVNT